MSVVAEAALGAAFQAFIPIFSDVLKSAQQYAVSVSEIERCEKLFMDIGAFLQDAEYKQLFNHFIKEWLDDLEDLAYDAEDILRSFKDEVQRVKINEQDEASSSLIAKIKSKAMNIKCIGKMESKATILKNMFLKLNRQFRDILGKLQGITERKNQLNLFAANVITSDSSTISSWSRDPGSFFPEHGMYGRETERQRITEFLLNQDTRIEVIAIVGMGGSGKTTLAQSIYNDSNIVEHFNSRAWVHVSKTFDVKRIIKAIYESLTSQPCQFDDTNIIKVRINEILREKTFLLVLDDVWNFINLEWDDLIAMLSFNGKEGSKVIVSTRISDLAAKVQSCGDYVRLGALSDEHCWELFCCHCGFSSTEILNTEFKEIGREIVGKCSGLPLAVRSIGRVLRCKRTKEEWEAVLRAVISNSNEREDEIMKILRTSYYDLSSDLKRCFLSCISFPEGVYFMEEMMVPIWIGLGIIPNEEKGRNYFQQLVSRSMLFPKGIAYSEKPAQWRGRIFLFRSGSTLDATVYVMHDLIRELGEEISGNLYIYIPLEFGHLPDTVKRTRHISFNMERLVFVQKELSSSNKKVDLIHLRSFIGFILNDEIQELCDGNILPHRNNECSALDNLFHQLKYLRVLILPGYQNSELPESLGGLRLLRHIDLSGSSIKKLPNSTTSLHNLEVLILRLCRNSKELPSSICDLVNLCYLDITGFSGKLPHGVEKLIKLWRLSDVVIGKDEGKKIALLKNLNLLRGELRIFGLSSIPSSEDAKLAQLGEKKLSSLLLNGKFNEADATTGFDVVEQLRPHQDLRKLYIRNYKGPSRFPSWVDERWLKHLKHLELYNCDKCCQLPSMGFFPFLEMLVIEKMHSLRHVGIDWYGTSYHSSFRKLKKLAFMELNEWEEWSWCDEVRFPDLCELYICNCPKLWGDIAVLEAMPMLQNLEISSCANLKVFLPSLPSLKNLHVSSCKYVDCGEEFDIQRLDVVKLSFKPGFVKLSDQIESRFTSHLFIEKIRGGMLHATYLAIGDHCFRRTENNFLTEKPRWFLEHCYIDNNQEEQPGKVKVLNLIVQDHHHLMYLPQWVCKSNNLRYLSLENCSVLKTLSPNGDLPASIAFLELRHCPELIHPWEDGNPPAELEGLQILKCPFMMQKLSENFNKLNSLQALSISGITLDAWQIISKSLPNLKGLELRSSPGIVSVPLVQTTEVWRCLTRLDIRYLPDLKQVSFREMCSLSHIELEDCPVLEKVFEELPPSLHRVRIKHCPEIAKMLSPENAQLQRKLSGIAELTLDGKRVYF